MTQRETLTQKLSNFINVPSLSKIIACISNCHHSTKYTTYSIQSFIVFCNIFSEISYSIDVIKPIIDQINKIVDEAETIYLEGANKAFDLPEFKSLELAKNFVNVLDEKEVMLDILDSGMAKDINVYIGDENDKEELKDFSVVTFKHSIGDKELGTIGIIGPKRMNYSKVISVMKYISKKISEQKSDEEKNK